MWMKEGGGGEPLHLESCLGRGLPLKTEAIRDKSVQNWQGGEKSTVDFCVIV